MLSVLMAVYAGDSPEGLQEAFRSIHAQTRPADEVVVTLDGPISDELRAAIDQARELFPLKVVPLEKNVGLGYALRIGLEHCIGPYVARLDADDICMSQRFERQLAYFENHPETALIGSWIGEFDSKEPTHVYAFRRVPETHEDILKGARLRNPFNHMTVMFRKDVIERVGSYRPARGLEDYDLWVRVLRAGEKTRNLPEPLVWARAGMGLLSRRGGLAYLSREYALLFEFYRSGFIGIKDLIVGLAIRTCVRMAPTKLRELSYRGLRLYGSYRSK